jgi:hypothetical protein
LFLKIELRKTNPVTAGNQRFKPLKTRITSVAVSIFTLIPPNTNGVITSTRIWESFIK